MCGTEQSPDPQLREIFSQLGFITSSRNVLSLLHRVRKAAEVSDITVLLEGETGTGKQVLAQGIHRLDKKRNRFAFVTVHCSTISEALAESELFGHQRGAFSGAVSERKGLFRAAEHGTLLLDDINDLPGPLQPKLLDVIQRGVVRPVGSDREAPIDVRVIAACNQPLEPLVRSGRFRSDLYHRLNVVTLLLPPLRQRKEDLPPLILALARRHMHLYQPIESVEPRLLTFLESMSFPGNVRELENTVQRMLFLKTHGTSLTMADWTAQVEPDVAPSADSDWLAQAAGALWRAISERSVPYARALEEIEKRVLETAIHVPGPRRELAEKLQTSERTLYYKMRAHGLTGPA